KLLQQSQAELAIGDYQRAIERAREAVPLLQKAGDMANAGLALNTLGSAQLYRGDYEAARVSFEQSLEIERAINNGNAEVARLNNIGNVYFFEGQYLEALRQYERALDVIKRRGDESWVPRRRQLTLANLATLYEQLGQNQHALDLYRRLRTEPSALTPGEQAQFLSNLGTLYRRLGDPVKALDNYHAAQRLFRREAHADGEIGVLQNIGTALAVDLNDLAGALRAFTEAGDLANKTSNRREIVQAHLYRGQTLYRMNRMDQARSEFEKALTLSSKIQTQEERWRALYGLGIVLARDGHKPAALTNLNAAIGEIEKVRSNIRSNSLKSEFLAGKRDVYDATISLLLDDAKPSLDRIFTLIEQARSRNFREMLPVESARLDIRALQSRLRKRTLLLDFWVGAGRMAVIWIRRDSAGAISRAMADESNLLAGIDPLTAPDVQHVIVVPDGALQSVAFEAQKIGGALLIEKASVSYLPTAAMAGHSYSASRIPLSPWREELLAFGDPIVAGQASLPMSQEAQQWAPLPNSLAEMRSIGSALAGTARIYSGADDLKKYVRASPLLHFSTHAVADSEDSGRSRILFSPEKDSADSQFLFWRDIQKLNLKGVDLVTVSACDTEGGRLVRGEGVQSFSRAFLAAGANATVTTLWRVADGPTAEFMKQFYHGLAKGQTKAEALRNAKLKFLRSGSYLAQPRYWAAFVLNGEGEAPIPRVMAWSQIIMGGGTLLLIGLLVSAAKSSIKKG
ncbi:MAG: CHAT domain-containing protein, partial [Acidobacteriota bacterium]|nr:CHAT domain-containing protein [Acidobacteriota bacterium]